MAEGLLYRKVLGHEGLGCLGLSQRLVAVVVAAALKNPYKRTLA